MIKNGAPQGFILGLLLFSIYINNLLYADETLTNLLASNRSELFNSNPAHLFLPLREKLMEGHLSIRLYLNWPVCCISDGCSTFNKATMQEYFLTLYWYRWGHSSSLSWEVQKGIACLVYGCRRAGIIWLCWLCRSLAVYLKFGTNHFSVFFAILVLTECNC